MDSELITNIKTLCHVEHLDIANELVPYSYTNSADSFIKFSECYLTNKKHIFNSAEVHWVDTIELNVEISQNSISLIVLDHDNKEMQIHATQRVKKNKRELITFDVLREAKLIYVAIGPESGRVLLNAIDITGRKMSDIVTLMKNIDKLWDIYDVTNLKENDLCNSELEDKKEKIHKLNEAIARLNLSITELKTTNEISKTQLESTRAYLNDDRKELERTKSEINKNKEKEKSLERTIDELSEQLKLIGTDIDDKSEKLIAVKRDLQEFQKKSEFYSEDFSAYKEELKKQNLLYTIFLAMFSICLIWVITNIYNSAISLVDNYQFNFDLWSLLVSRLPIISINIVILGIVSTLLYQVINLITNNFDKVASLKQITYLVKECIDSQSKDLTIDQEKILKTRIEKKMELIREHINK